MQISIDKKKISTWLGIIRDDKEWTKRYLMLRIKNTYKYKHTHTHNLILLLPFIAPTYHTFFIVIVIFVCSHLYIQAYTLLPK